MGYFEAVLIADLHSYTVLVSTYRYSSDIELHSESLSYIPEEYLAVAIVDLDSARIENIR